MSTPYSESEILNQLTQVGGWTLQDRAIQRRFTFDTFLHAIAFVNQVAELAEAENHHPDIDIRYTEVQLSLSTHDAGGITTKDFALARRINALL